MTVTLHHGDCLDVMATLPDCSVDSIVTDPPYGLGFMGKAWDGLPPGLPWAQECLRVLKPGGHLLAFGGTRTFHRLAVAVEDAGFEIRDSIAWLHGQGFPKGKQQLKPAFEPVVVSRKPGGATLQVDACRIGTGDDIGRTRTTALGVLNDDGWKPKAQRSESHAAGRWPANVCLDESQAAALDEMSGIQRDGVAVQRNGGGQAIFGAVNGVGAREDVTYGGRGGASRFFYVAKASTRERPKVDGTAHPTVKPLALMRWLCRLVTPPRGTVLEPFAGSGTTVEACLLEGFDCIAIERESDYLPLIQQRIDRHADTLFGQEATA